MLEYQILTKDNTEALQTTLSGKALLSIAQLNKSTAFSEQEREAFNLVGKLPYQVESIEQQVERAYEQYNAYKEPLNKNLFLNRILNTNMVLFYKILETYIEEMLPIIYTPIVGAAVQEFHRKFASPRGLYISYPESGSMEAILGNRTHPEIDLIVCTDGEGVLGIGDQGISAMAIAIAKLTVYSAFGKINPMRTLPIMLDVGTNNQELLNDPMYLGWRSPRVQGQDYDTFIDKFVQTIKTKFPNALLHFEDLGRENAQRVLDKYDDNVCTFNDDIQGTGVVALAAIISAIKQAGTTLQQQKIVVFGSGTAGMGVSHQLYNYLLAQGIEEQAAREMFWLVDRDGLLTTHSQNVTASQTPYLKPYADVKNLVNKDGNQLYNLVAAIQPTILIGCSAQSGAFNKAVVTEMHKHCKKPIILPLSNPTEKAEANPSDLYRWTDGAVITATGSPFPPVKHNDQTIEISQCNNYLAFPGIGMGVISIGAKKITQNMLMCASNTLANITDDADSRLLPSINTAVAASHQIAVAVAKQAQADGVASIDGDAESLIKQHSWKPRYLPYIKA